MAKRLYFQGTCNLEKSKNENQKIQKVQKAVQAPRNHLQIKKNFKRILTLKTKMKMKKRILMLKKIKKE